MPVTLTIADDLANELRAYEGQLAEILKLGVREWQARGEAGYTGLNSVLEKLAGLPDPREILELRPSPQWTARLEALLDKGQTSALGPSEQREWDQYEYIEHLVRLAKIRRGPQVTGRMSVSTHQTIRAGLTAEHLRQYAGKWIAVAADGSHVVAAAEELTHLDELICAAGEDPEAVGLERIEVDDILLGGAELL